jgi:hypothetical protein
MKRKIQLFLLISGLIGFSCDKEELKKSNELKGTWEWYATCGGFVGCLYAKDYPAESQYRIVVDDQTMRTIESNGDTSTVQYQLNGVENQDNGRVFEVELEDGTKYNAIVEGNSLTKEDQSGMPVVTMYKRVE